MSDYDYVDPENPQHVSFPCDDHPLESAPRLHILGVLDYWVAVAPGTRVPMAESVRARTSGERDPCVTMLIATLWKYGKGDYAGAAGCARTFVEQLSRERGAVLDKDASELALDEIAKLCGCARWEYPRQVVRDVKARFEALDDSISALERISNTLDSNIIPALERIVQRQSDVASKDGDG